MDLHSFAGITLDNTTLLGAGIGPIERDVVLPVLEVLAAVTGVLAVGALVSGSLVLVRETRIAVQTLQDRAAGVRARVAAHGASTSRPGDA